MTAPRIERRLAAILAMDVAGYSQLMGADELGTLNGLKAHRRERIDPEIARHNGRIVTIAGDGLMVEFASVVDAVACAVAIQRAMVGFNANVAEARRIVLRIGINVGDIIIDGGDIFGDGVNVAARLETLCEPGGVCISRSANDQVRDRLSISFADLGEQTVKNIARAVGVFGLSADDIAALPAHVLPQSALVGGGRLSGRSSRRWVVVAGVVAVFALAGAAGWWLVGAGARPAVVAAVPVLPARPAALDRRGSLIVLPFEGGAGRISRDIGERVAADYGWPVVPAAARYQGRPPEPRTIGREQNVHFVLTGSAAEQDGRLRVAASLFETQEGREVWSLTFDRAAARDTAGDVVATVALDVHQAMIDAEVARARRERPAALDTTDYYLAAIESAVLPLTRVNLAARIGLLDQAIALDPANAVALSLAARLRVVQVLNEWSVDREGDLAFAGRTVDRLLEGRGRDVYLLRTKAYVLRAQGNLEQALAVNRRVLEISPNLADTQREIGVILHGQGKFAESLASFQDAKRSGDSDFVLDAQTATALLATGRWAEAVVVARAAIAESPARALDWPLLVVIAAESASGMPAEARADLDRYLAGTPAIRTLADVRKDRYLAGTPNLLEGLQRAGMPEG